MRAAPNIIERSNYVGRQRLPEYGVDLDEIHLDPDTAPPGVNRVLVMLFTGQCDKQNVLFTLNEVMRLKRMQDRLVEEQLWQNFQRSIQLSMISSTGVSGKNGGTRP